MNDSQVEQDAFDDGVRTALAPPDNVVTLPTITADKALADDIKAKLGPILNQACELISTGRRHGLIVSFNLQPDQFGIQRVATLDVLKPL